MSRTIKAMGVITFYLAVEVSVPSLRDGDGGRKVSTIDLAFSGKFCFLMYFRAV